MNKYIIYTPQGYCEDPHGKKIYNCQVLGKVEADNENEAIQRLFEEEPWIKNNGYIRDVVYVAQLDDSEIV